MKNTRKVFLFFARKRQNMRKTGSKILSHERFLKVFRDLFGVSMFC